MDKTDRIIIAVFLMSLVVMISICSCQSNRRLSALEVRLQKVEHMLSLSISESRSSVPIGPTNGLPAFAPAPRKRTDSKIK